MINILDYAKLNDYEGFEYFADIQRMIKVCNDRGINILPKLAKKLWNRYSDNLCACWLYLPDSDEELFEILFNAAKEYNKKQRSKGE